MNGYDCREADAGGATMKNSVKERQGWMVSLEGLRARRQQLWEWIDQPSPTGPLRLRLLWMLLRISVIFSREFSRDKIPLRASALTFTVMLSLVPTLALGTAVLKGLGAGDQMRLAAHRFIDQLESASSVWDDYLPESGEQKGRQSTEETQPSGAPQGKEDEDNLAPVQNSTAHLRQAVDQIFDYVDRTDFATLGAFGVLGLVAAVVMVMGSIEQAMNAIWHTGGGRPMGRRVMDYLALMVVLPLAINLTFATEATLQSETLRRKLHFFLPIGGLEELLLGLIPLLLLTLSFTLLYRFLPNTRVRLTPALLGGLFGAVAWLVVQGLYLKMQLGVARYNAIYGSFATLPLFLIWMQLCWTIFLAGAEMSFAAQSFRAYRFNAPHASPVNRLTLAFALLEIIHRNFTARHPADPAQIAEELGQPVELVNKVAAQLSAAGLIRWTGEESERGEWGYLPGTNLEKVNPSEVVDLILGTDIPAIRGGALTMEAMEAARRVITPRNLIKP